MASTSQIVIDQPEAPKIDVDAFFVAAFNGTPPSLHPYFKSFQDLYQKKCALSMILIAVID